MAKKEKSPRKKDGSILEHTKGENRKLRKQVAVLRKELEKSIHYRPKVLDEVVEDDTPETDTSCPKCSSKLKFIDLPNKQVIACSECNYRQILKKELK